MAYVNIRNAVVDRKFFEGKGLAIHEEFTKRDGTTGKAYFTAWFDEAPEVEIGDTISGGGTHSFRLEQYTNNDGEEKTSVNISINGFTLRDEPDANDDL